MHPLIRTSLPAILATFTTLAPGASAQDSVLFSMDGDETLLDGANGLIGAASLLPDEVAIVTPDSLGASSARTFLTAGAQFVFIGDLDQDGYLVDDGQDAPGQDNDAIFVKRFTGAPGGSPVSPREVYFSKEAESDLDPSFQDGDVFRYAGQGVLEVFVTEAQLRVALGTAEDIDTNAICQSAAGDLFLSLSDFSTAITTPSGPVVSNDGDLLHIPAADVTYDGSGNVLAIVPDSVVLLATEADVSDLIVNSAVRTSTGGDPVTALDLSGLEIDPSGGTWTPPQAPTLSVPDLLLSWEGFTNDGAIVSTAMAGGSPGSIAVINGRAMGSTIATTGAQIGLQPGPAGLGGLNGFALVPAQAPPFSVESHPSNFIDASTTLYTEQQITGATPGGVVVVFYDRGPAQVGGVLDSYTFGSIGGELFATQLQLTVLAVVVADAQGFARATRLMPPHLRGSGINIAIQVYDVAGGRLGLPVGMQFP